MARAILDTSCAPVVVVVFPDSGTIDEVRAYYADLRAVLERPGPPLWFIVDLSAVDVLRASPLHRRTAADEYQKISQLFEERVGGEVFVISNVLVRGLYLAFTWMVGGPPNVTREMLASEEVARAWISSHAGISLATLPRFAAVLRGAT